MIARRGLAVICLALAAALSSCGSDAENPATTSLSSFGRMWITHVEGYRANRAIYIYFPSNHALTRTYPVLVVLDGQTAFGGPATFHLDHVVDSLTAAGTIPPTIVVGVASAAGRQRFTEYIPDEGGETFLTGVRDTLLPELRRRFPLTDDPDSTYLIGSSLGGLMAAYAAFAHDGTFRRTAGLSVSYAYYPDFIRTMRDEGHGNVARFYQDTGDGDDNWFSHLEDVEALARDSLGFVPDCDIKTVLAHGDHNYYSWSNRMPSIIAYLLGPPGDACGVAMRRP